MRTGRLTAAAAAAVLAFAGAAQAGPPTLDLRGAWVYDDNLGNAESVRERTGDHGFAFDAVAGYAYPVNDISGFVIKAGLESEVHADLTDLDQLTALTSLTYLIQPWRGFSAPWFALFGEYRWREHDDSDIRDGTLGTFGITAGQRITDRISARLRYEFLDRDAREARAFELLRRTFSSHVDYRVTDRFTVSARHVYLDGDLVTTAGRNRKFRGVARASAMDPAFGPGRIAWRLDGHSHTLRLGGKYVLAKHTAFDFGGSFSSAHADNDNQWRSWRVGAALLHRFR